ncbi:MULTISPECIES: hypothetical protein [unclassified Microcoleus]|uniref:hypothetical protein n=1 Tax=unclassified Microcoleus TaxID=2642155 RepID=UPI002FD194CD
MSAVNSNSSTVINELEPTIIHTWTENLDIAHTWTENLDIAHTWTENLDIAHTWTENLDISHSSHIPEEDKLTVG